MHFDRQLLYLAFFFGAEKVSGLAIDRSRPGEKFASVSSPDLTYTTHDATMAQASKTDYFWDSSFPTASPYKRFPPGAGPRMIDSASRAAKPSLSYDATLNSFSALAGSDLSLIVGSVISLVQTSTISSSALPTITSDGRTDLASHLELRQDSGVPCSADGEVVCNGTKEFGICNWGRVVFEPVADGTSCVNGKIGFDSSASGAASSGTVSLSSAAPSQSSGSVSQSIGPASLSSVSASLSSDPASSSSGRSLSSVPPSQSSFISSQSSTPLSASSTSILPSSTSSSQSSVSISQSSETKSQPSTSQTSLTVIHTPTHHVKPTTRTLPTTHPTPTTIHTNTHHTPTPHTLNPTNVPGNTTAPDSNGTHPISNASIAGIVSGLAAGAVLLGLAGLYLYRRRQQGKPLFGARGSQRSTGSYYPKSAWLYDPQISQDHSRAHSEAGQNLIPDPRPDTVEMEAGIPGSPDMRPARSSSPLLPAISITPAISLTRDDSPEGSPGGSPRRSGGRRSRPMMSINEED